MSSLFSSVASYTTRGELAAGMIPEPDDAIAFLYDHSQVQQFELRLSPENMKFLDDDPTAEEWVPGTLVYEGVSYDKVGIRYKGSVGSWIGCVENATPDKMAAGELDISGARVCSKLSLKVSFNKYDKEGRFFGVKKLLFHSMNNDPSQLRDRLAYQLFRLMGVAAPRANHAIVTINGRTGLYANIESVDGRFTRSRFATGPDDGEGNLYKEVWPTAGALPLAPLTKERLHDALETNEDEASVDDILLFNELIIDDWLKASGNKEGSPRRHLERYFNVPNLASFFAVDRTIRADDGPFHFYCSPEGCANHNFYFYDGIKRDKEPQA